MDPWSSAAVSLTSVKAAASALQSAAKHIQPLAAGFQSFLTGDMPTLDSGSTSPGNTTSNEGNASGLDSLDSLDSLASEIRARVAEILGFASLKLHDSSQLELSALSNVYVVGQVEDQAEIEAILDADQGLKGLLEQWKRLGSGTPFTLAPPSKPIETTIANRNGFMG